VRILRLSQRRSWELETQWKWRQLAPAKAVLWLRRFSHRPFLTKAQAKFQAISYGVYDGQSYSGNFSSGTSVFPCQCHNANPLYSYFSYPRSTVQNLDPSAASLSKAFLLLPRNVGKNLLIDTSSYLKILIVSNLILAIILADFKTINKGTDIAIWNEEGTVWTWLFFLLWWTEVRLLKSYY